MKIVTLEWVRLVLTSMGTSGTHAHMSAHTQIIERFSGPAELARVTGMSSGAAKQARRRGSIPPKYWQKVAEAEKATLEELALAAAQQGEAA